MLHPGKHGKFKQEARVREDIHERIERQSQKRYVLGSKGWSQNIEEFE